MNSFLRTPALATAPAKDDFDTLYDQVKSSAEEAFYNYYYYEYEDDPAAVWSPHPPAQDRSSGGRESKHLSASRPSLGSSLLAGFNTVMRAILVPNQIAPRVAAECFRFDCARQPGHGCCLAHAATKRHTEEQEEQEDSRSTSRRHTEEQQGDSRVTSRRHTEEQ